MANNANTNADSPKSPDLPPVPGIFPSSIAAPRQVWNADKGRYEDAK